MPSFHPPMHWLGQLAQLQSIDLSHPDGVEALQIAVATEVENAVAQPIKLYGHRVEAMFAYVLAGLGGVAALKQEDAGLAYIGDTAASPPDFRVRLTDGREVFIEVKTHRDKSLTKNIRLKQGYLRSKQAYASAWGCELYFAFWWRNASQWLLLKGEDFISDDTHYSLTTLQAMKRSRMVELGDISLGTLPPLALHLHLPSAQIAPYPDGQLDWNRATRSFTMAGKIIRNAEEKRFAWYLLQFGSWNSVRNEEAELEDGSRVHSFYAEPEEWETEQGFAMIGTLSGMISNAFRFQTQRDGRVSAIVPDAAINSLGTHLPEGPSGVDLKLWRFKILPNFK